MDSNQFYSINIISYYILKVTFFARAEAQCVAILVPQLALAKGPARVESETVNVV